MWVGVPGTPTQGKEKRGGVVMKIRTYAPQYIHAIEVKGADNECRQNECEGVSKRPANVVRCQVSKCPSGNPHRDRLESHTIKLQIAESVPAEIRCKVTPALSAGFRLSVNTLLDQ